MMKKLLAILLSISIIFTFSLGTAFAGEGEPDPGSELPGAEEPENPDVDPAPEPDDKTDKKVKKSKKKVIKVSQVKGVDADTSGSSSIKISWKGVKGASGYKVYRYNVKKDKYVLIKTVKSSKKRSYKNTDLKSSRKYTYKVAAYKKYKGKTYTGKKSKKSSATTKAPRGTKAISIAKSKIGCSYRSGHVGPSSFDCSGFVYYVYNTKKAGKVKFKRTSAQGEYNQLKKYKVGSSIKSAKKGDILFFSSSGSTHGIYHTGIYLGDGKMIHAANPRKGVCICKTKYVPHVCAVVRISK